MTETVLPDARSVRVPMELYIRLSKMKKPYESWGAFLNRVIPEKAEV